MGEGVLRIKPVMPQAGAAQIHHHTVTKAATQRQSSDPVPGFRAIRCEAHDEAPNPIAASSDAVRS